jgi:hypothetical protein
LGHVYVFCHVKCDDEEHKHHTLPSGERDRLLQSCKLPVLSDSLLSVVETECSSTDSYSDLGLTTEKYKFGNYQESKMEKSNIKNETLKLSGWNKNIINMTMKI